MAKQNTYPAAAPADGDYVTGVDISNTTDDAGGSTSGFLFSAIYSYITGKLNLGALADLNTVGTSQIDNDAVTAAKLDNTGVTSGSYTSADLTVDENGRVTAASNGTASSGGDAWGDAVDANIVPDADGTRDLGSSANRFNEVHTNSIDLDGETITSVSTKTAPTGDVVGTTDTQTLTNKTLTAPKTTYALNAQTGTAYTLALADQNAALTMDNASAQTVTVPANATVALPVGSMVAVHGIGAGAVSVTGASGVTINGVSAGSADLTAQWSGTSLLKVATDTWVLSGDHGGVS